MNALSRKMFLKLFFLLLLVLGSSGQVFAESKTTFYHYDLLGSPVATTNESGAVVWREEYTPYGEKRLKQDANKDNVRGYTGHVHDKETGLTYMQARYYDPQIGRFMGIDPVGFQESNPIMFNRYAYANNNPYKFVDPNGEIPKKTVNLLSKISDKYDNYKCADCAREMISTLENEGISGKLVATSAKNKSPLMKTTGIHSDKMGKQISKTDEHYGVVVDGKVTDNNTPIGVGTREWAGDLGHRLGLNFTEIGFGPKEGYEKAKNAIRSIAFAATALGASIAATVSEEVEAAGDDPVQSALDWSGIQDFFGEPLE